jgi:hypothetical protein
MFVCCVYIRIVLSCVGRGLCDGLITRPEESYRMSNCVWLRNLKKRRSRPDLGCRAVGRKGHTEVGQVSLRTCWDLSEGGVGLVPKRGCLLTLPYYAFPRWYEFGERRWNDIGRGKQKNSEKNLSQCHFVHHKSHMDWPGRVSRWLVWCCLVDKQSMIFVTIC